MVISPITTTRPVVVETSQATAVLTRVKRGQGLRRSRAKKRQGLVDRGKDDLYIAVCESGCNESGDLTIAGVVVSMNKANGIARDMAFTRKLGEKRIQVVLKIPSDHTARPTKGR